MAEHAALLHRVRELLDDEADRTSRVGALLWYRAHRVWSHEKDRAPPPPEPLASIAPRSRAPLDRLTEDQFLRAFGETPSRRHDDPVERHLTALVLWHEAVADVAALDAACVFLGRHWLARDRHDDGAPPGSEDLGLLLSSGEPEAVSIASRHLRQEGPAAPLARWTEYAPRHPLYPHTVAALLALMREGADVISPTAVRPCLHLLLSLDDGIEAAHVSADLQEERATSIAALLPQAAHEDHERVASWAVASHNRDDVLAWGAIATLAAALHWRELPSHSATIWLDRARSVLARQKTDAINSEALLVVRALHLGGDTDAAALIPSLFEDDRTTARAWLTASTGSSGREEAIAFLGQAATRTVAGPPRESSFARAFVFEPNPITALADALVRGGPEEHGGWGPLAAAFTSDAGSDLLVQALWILAAGSAVLAPEAHRQLASAARELLHHRGQDDLATPAALALAAVQEPPAELPGWVASWLGSQDPRRRRAGIDVLGLARHIADDLTEALLLPRLGDVDVGVRAAAVEVLCSGPRLSTEARRLILRAASSPGSALPAAALRGLIRADDELRRDLLGDVLLLAEGHQSFEVRQAARLALADDGQPVGD